VVRRFGITDHALREFLKDEWALGAPLNAGQSGAHRDNVAKRLGRSLRGFLRKHVVANRAGTRKLMSFLTRWP
jgi:hypothetical protein